MLYTITLNILCLICLVNTNASPAKIIHSSEFIDLQNYDLHTLYRDPR